MTLAACVRLRSAAGVTCLMSLLVCPTASAQSSNPKNVLTIHTGPEDHPSNLVLDKSIREALAAPPDVRIDYFAEYLETERFGVEEASLTLRDYLGRKYRSRRIDLVIAMTDTSLQFVLDRRDELFPEAPIVYAGLAVPNEIVRNPDRPVAAVLLGVAYAETLKVALALHPEMAQVFVVARTNSTSRLDIVETELRDFQHHVKLAYINERTVPGLLAAVRAIPPRSLVLYLWHQAEDGNVTYPDEIARLVAQASAVPVYGTSDFYVGLGVVGGVVRQTSETGTRLGEMARRILAGTRPQDIPIEDARVVPLFDWRQIERWGIDPARLPPGSDIRFRVPNAWESYRAYIVGTLVVVAAQLLLIARLLRQRAKLGRAEETLRTSYERIRQLAGRLINAQEEARASIARDLHDHLGQLLAGLSMTVSNVKRSSGRVQDVQTQQAFSRLQQETLDIFHGIRRLSHELHPATLQLLGLTTALQTHCSEVEKQHGVQVNFRSEGDVGRLKHDVGVCLFRIAQESLRNGIVHGAARRLWVSLIRSGEYVELTVTDDGEGFDLEAVRRSGGGLGLVSMEERAHVIGGDVHIASRLHEGTTVRVRVPSGTGESSAVAAGA